MKIYFYLLPAQAVVYSLLLSFLSNSTFRTIVCSAIAICLGCELTLLVSPYFIVNLLLLCIWGICSVVHVVGLLIAVFRPDFSSNVIVTIASLLAATYITYLLGLQFHIAVTL